MNEENVFLLIDKMEEDMIEDLRTMVAIPSYITEKKEGMPFGENAALALKKFLSLADEKGLLVSDVDGYMGTIDLDEKEPYLGILNHLDVVPEGEGWSYPPYGGVIEDGKMYGRGTTDNKGAAISVLYALKAIRESGIELKKGVRLLVGTNEENGSSDLEYYTSVRKMPPHVFTPDGMYPVINVEKGMLRVTFEKKIQHTSGCLVGISGANMVNAVPSEARVILKGIQRDVITELLKDPCLENVYIIEETDHEVHIRAVGVGAHASTPELGKNALNLLYPLLARLPLKDECGLFRDLMQLFPYQEFDGASVGAACEDEISGKLTLVNSMASYEKGRYIGHIDIRFPVTETKSRVLSRLSKVLGERGITITEAHGSEGHAVDAESEFVQTLLAGYTKHTGRNAYPISMGGGTYVHNIDGGVAFGILYPDEENVNTHGADEFIKVEHLTLNAKIFADVIMKLCM